MSCYRYIGVLWAFFLYSLSFYAQQDVLILDHIVTDNANIFSETEREYLKIQLTNFEKETTTQIVVVTIKSLQGETIEQYALNLFNANKLGQKNADNGLLILYADVDKEVRIEVGYGLESVITDAIASRIIREIMIPNFKNEEKFEGIFQATAKIIALVNDPELIDEFISTTNDSEDNDETKGTLYGRFFGSLFLTPILFLLGVFGYNKVVVKNNIRKKISVSKVYKKDKKMFFSVLLLGILIVGSFVTYFYLLFFALFILSFLSVFVIIGFKIILKLAHDRLKIICKGLFTGKLGIIIFPFYLPATIFLFIAGLIFTFTPICMLVFMIIQIILKNDINEYLTSFKLIYLLYALISVFTVFVIVSIFSAISEISKKRSTYGISFFENDIAIGNHFSGNSGSGSRSYSSGGSYSSSSSSSSFSGGGGSSGGGGASGSW